ncbi:Sugar/inositol transporter [Niveomyces insectorum RCEF 264]|uniref:Sugar/inositol transporter n=1 Tax=Niveomyces insectorum RCEF 264 TaxID=1081102 RepID=A0A167RTM2_9HYPO|nr:Sugar/inositol transporter [Niveomyces insectorum RCEF 264]
MATRKQYLGLRGRKLQMAMLILVVAPSFILFGYNNGSTGGISGLPSFIAQFPQYNTDTGSPSKNAFNARVKGVVTGCYDLGAVCGSLLCLTYSDRIGRLRTLLCGLILSIIALAIEASSFSIAQFIVGRLLIGGGIGTISAAVPVWQSECASSAHRGALVIVEGLCISSGITLSEWVSFGLSFAPEGSVQWRVPLVFPVIFALFVIPFVFCMPESPRWLARVGRIDEARAVLAALADEDEDSPTVQQELRGVEHSLAIVRGSLKELFHNGEERVMHRAVLACVGQVFQQMCGISALVFYTSTVFVDLGFKGMHARLMGACLTTFQTCASTVPVFIIDRVGRRKLFMTAGTGLAICSAIIAGTGDLKGHASIAAVVFIFAYDFFYPLGFLGQTFLYASEVSPLRFRVPITAIANATQWLSQFVVAQITPPGTQNLGNKFWIIFAVLNASFVPIVYFFFPETKGRSLEDIDILFKHTNSIFDAVSVARKMTIEQARHEEAVTETEKESVGSANEKETTEAHTLA